MTKTFKKTLALLLSVVMLMSVIPMGYSFAIDTVISGDYAYMLSEAGATITAYKGTDTVIEIPGTLDGNTVVAISCEEEVAKPNSLMPFHSNKTITSVTIPDSVEYIGYGAFYKCAALETVNFGNGVKVIGGGAFRDCKLLTSVVLWGITTLDVRSFQGCTSLTTVTLGKNIASIAADAFASCGALTTINYEGTEEQWNAIANLPVFANSVTINYEYAYDCAVYGHIIGEKVDAADATCDTNGTVAHWPCTKCEISFFALIATSSPLFIVMGFAELQMRENP